MRAIKVLWRLDWRYVVGVVAETTAHPHTSRLLAQGTVIAAFIHVDSRAAATTRSTYPMRDLVVAGVGIATPRRPEP